MARFVFKVLPNWFKKEIGPQLAFPKSSFYARLTKGFFVYMSTHLEENAVRLCNIQPNDRVLEIGFGPGIGLRTAYPKIKDGEGTIYGIDKSEFMMSVAKKRVKTGIEEGKIVLFQGCASDIPLDTNSIDHIYHCNCFYFWPDPLKVIHELHRVMKPGSCMVTTLSLPNIKMVVENGVLPPEQCDPAPYMKHLEQCGFVNVRMDHFRTPLRKWSLPQPRHSLLFTPSMART